MNAAPLLVATSLLTVLPVARWLSENAWNEQTRSKAIDYYGLVGLGIGAIIIFITWFTQQSLPVHLASAVILITWVSLTGALHLDGLADCCDAAAAGHAKPSQYLAVMKSPEVGAMAIVAVCLQLLLKFALLSTLLSAMPVTLGYWLIITAILVSRLLAASYQQTTPYAREHGMGLQLPQRYFIVNGLVLVIFIGVGVWYFSAPMILIILIASTLLLLLWRRVWMRRIGGYTGDCIGAFIEINESWCLLLGVILWSETP